MLFHPYIVLEPNKLESRDVVYSVAERCRRENLQILVPHVAGYEFSKGNPTINWRKSLREIAPFADLVVAGVKCLDLCRDEWESGVPSVTLVDLRASIEFRQRLRRIASGDESAIDELLQGPGWKAMEESQELWSRYDDHKSSLVALCNCFRRPEYETVVNELRRSRGQVVQKITQWLRSDDGVDFVAMGMVFYGANSDAARRLAGSLSVARAFLSYCAALALHWIAMSGLDTANAKEVTNDWHDLEYGVMGALSADLITSDGRLRDVYKAVRDAFEC